ncbi:MAG: hypothetical protein JXB32_04285 [Deltaproteobacteria bacterium]|nr:hypothetical protein [Deltaproteobacteria bacterium]
MKLRIGIGTLVAAVALAGGFACKKQGEEAASGGGGGQGAATEPAAAGPALAEKELAFGKVKFKVSVPADWEEKIETGSFASARYTTKDFRYSLAFDETCCGMCEAEKWADNVKAEAAQYASGEMFQPPVTVEVKENGEVAPGAWVFVGHTAPVDPATGARSQALLKVWRYGADWEQIVTCEFSVDRDDAEGLALLESLRNACLGLERLGPAQPAS